MKPFDKSITTPIMRIKYDTGEVERPKLSSPEDAAAIFYAIEEFNDSIEHHETFYTAYLNSANNVVGVLKIGEGAIDNTTVDVRIVMQGALLTNATAIILCHNHPSGSVKASAQDIQTTKKMQSAAALFNICITDHLIISKNQYFSMRGEGLL